MARLNPSAKIYAIDYIPELVELTSENLRKADADLLDSRRIVPIVGDGWKGHAAGAPYDAIHVGAAAEALPKSLIDQLAVLIPLTDSFTLSLTYLNKKSIMNSLTSGWWENAYSCRSTGRSPGAYSHRAAKSWNEY